MIRWEEEAQARGFPSAHDMLHHWRHKDRLLVKEIAKLVDAWSDQTVRRALRKYNVAKPPSPRKDKGPVMSWILTHRKACLRMTSKEIAERTGSDRCYVSKVLRDLGVPYVQEVPHEVRWREHNRKKREKE